MNDQPDGAGNPYAPPRTVVSDPVAANGELAGRGTRLGAAILDGLIVFLLVYLPVMITAGPALFRAGLTGARPQLGGTAALGLGVSGVAFIAWCVVTLVMVHRSSQTIAKKLLSIKVVRGDGSRAGLGRIFWLRNAVMMGVGLVPLVGMLAGVVDMLCIFGEKRKCLHDMIADTKVVRV